jgi:hypothetical protein
MSSVRWENSKHLLYNDMNIVNTTKLYTQNGYGGFFYVIFFTTMNFFNLKIQCGLNHMQYLWLYVDLHE